jgi:KUP system potassium uptake protein
VCLVLVTFITTNLVALVAIIVWRIHPLLVFVIWLPFITLDGLFLSASLIKVPDGAWFTIMLAASLAIFFVLWRYGKEKQWTSEAKEQNELSSLVSRSAATGNQALTEKYGGADLTQIDGLAIFLDKTGHSTPKVYEQWLCKFRAQMDVTVLMHMRALAVPHVPEPERFEVTKTSVKNVYRVILRHGYDDHVFTPDLTELIYDEVHRAIIRGVVMPSGDGEEEEEDDDDDDDDDDIASGVPPEKKVFPSDAMVAARLDRLEDAFAAQTLFLVGKQQLRICPEYHFVKRWALSAYLWIREISRNKTEKLNVPVDKLVEVGFVGKI